VLETATNTGVTRTERASVARVRALLERCAKRESVSDSDWAYEENGFSYREFADGWLAKAKADEAWVLYRCTQTGYDPIARGPLVEIECDTREVVLFGPPCGLDDGAGSRSWAARLRPWELKEGSLQATTIGGMFRLMLEPDGRGTLLYIRKNLGTDVLGTDDVETLKRTADDLRQQHRGKSLRVWVAGEMVELHGVGVLGVVGQIEFLRGTQLLLVRGDDDDEYDLYHVLHDGTCVLLSSYSGADLHSGDLGSILVPRPVQSAESFRTSPDPPASDGPAPPRSGGRAPPHLGRTPPLRATNKSSTRTTQPVLTDDDARRLETALTPDKEKWTGDGVTTLPYFFAAFDILIRQRKLKNMCLWCPGIQTLMAKEANVTVPGEPRTFARGFALFVGMTGLGTKRGRKWEIPFADFGRSGSAGMTKIREMHEPAPPRNTEPSAPASAPEAHAPPEATRRGGPTATPAGSTPAAASAPTTTHARSATHARLTTTPPIGSAVTRPADSTPTATHASPITHVSVKPTPTTPTNSGSAETPPAVSTPTATHASPIMHATETPTPTATSAPTATLGSATHARSVTPQTPATATASAMTQPSTPTATATASAVTQRLTATLTAAHAGTGRPSPPPATSTPTAAAPSMSPPTPAPSADQGVMSAPTPAASTISTATLPGAPSEGLPGETGPPLAEARATGPPLTDVRVTGPPLTDDEPADDGHWHRTIRVDGQPTAWEPLRIKLPTEPGPSQWNGKKARGPSEG